MPVYNIEVPPQTRNAWAEGLGSLADAFAPNPALEIERAKAGMAREELNFNMDLERDKFGLLQAETAADISRMNAAAAAAIAQGDYYGAQTLTAAAEKLKVEAETNLLTLEHGNLEEFEAGVRGMGEFDPTTGMPDLADIVAPGLAAGLTNISPAQLGAMSGAPMESLDPLVYAEHGNAGNTVWGINDAQDAALELERNKPIILGENQIAHVPPGNALRTDLNQGLLTGRSTNTDTEQTRLQMPDGSITTHTGPNYTADAPTPPDFNVYTWTDESGVQHQTMARVLTDGRIVDREMSELPMTAIETPVSVNATSLSGASLGVKTEADKKVFSLLRRMINSDKYLQTDPVPGVMQFMMAIPGDSMWSTLSRRLLSNDPAESFMASAQQFLTAVLRLDSGAAVPITEYPSYYAQFIPLPGDGAETIRRKAEARRVAMEALRDPLMGEASAEDLMIRVSEEVGEPPPLPAAIAAAAGLPRGRVVEDPAAAAGAPATAAPAQRKYEWTFNPGAS